MGNKKSKQSENKSPKGRLVKSTSNQNPEVYLKKHTISQQVPKWTRHNEPTYNRSPESKVRTAGNRNRTIPTNSSSVIDATLQRNARDIDTLLESIKSYNYSQFCQQLQTRPFIQSWKIFEEAVHMDTSFSIVDSKEISPDFHSFTLRLMDNGYQITEKELERMEMRLMLKAKFRVLKTCIIDHYLSGIKSLQELCRQSLKRYYQHNDTNYRTFVRCLNYPEKLKDFLLQ